MMNHKCGQLYICKYTQSSVQFRHWKI